ncbi:acyl-CoA dehydrogenase family protein [bacterium]|nr:acyl-CoA dehydrogenase family protein [bacterium]
MDFSLDEETRMIKESIHKWAQEKALPLGKQIDESREIPQELIKELGELGYLAPYVPAEYGGAGLTYTQTVIIAEELARGEAGLATLMGAHNSLCCYSIINFGTDEQKKKYLPKLATGEYIGSFALTEPEAGSDASNIQTTAILSEDKSHFLVNGHKQWITNGDVASVIILIAMTDPSRGLMGISPIIIEKGMEGFTTGHVEDTMGIRGSHQTELFFENLKVPYENLLGGDKNMGKGFKVAMNVLDGGRIGMGAAAVGIAFQALHEALEYAKKRKQFGKLITDFQSAQWKFANLATEIQAARWLVMHAAWLKDNGERCTSEAAQAKMYASDMCVQVCLEAIQIMGGYGYSKEYPVEKHLRDAKIKQIYEGTNEIQRLVISRNVIKKGLFEL